MDKKAHNKTKALNERLIVFIMDISEALKGDPELPENIRYLRSVSNYLNKQSLKSIEDVETLNNKL